MLKFVATFFLILGGITAQEICDQMASCLRNEIPHEFPETSEDLQNVCRPAVAFLECTIRAAEECQSVERDRLEHGRQILAVVREICSEDTLLHAVVVDNLACFKKLESSDEFRCGFGGDEAEITSQIYEALQEEGLLSTADIQNDTVYLRECLGELNYMACESLKVEKTCGELAMNAFAEIAQRINLAEVEGCPGTSELLPAVIRLRRVEEEKQSNFLKDLLKRK